MKSITCKNCKFMKLTELETKGSVIYSDYKCTYGNQIALVKQSEKETKPSWCPIANNENDYSLTESTTSCKVHKLYKDLTYMQQRDLWEKIKPTTKWEDIKANTTYHVPPTYINGKGYDIFITDKTVSCAHYKKVLESGSLETYEFALYPSSPISKRIAVMKKSC